VVLGIWNEANGAAYWHASPQEFYKLHDYAVDAVRRALPTARVGGPDVAGSGGAFMDGFLKHVVSEKNYATGQMELPPIFFRFTRKVSRGSSMAMCASASPRSSAASTRALRKSLPFPS